MATCVTGRDDPFLLSLATPLLSLSWSVKGKYGPLICLVEYVGANHLLKLHPDLPDSILGALQEHALACYVCTYRAIFYVLGLCVIMVALIFV